MRLLAMSNLKLSARDTSCDNLNQTIPITRNKISNFQNPISQESFHA